MTITSAHAPGGRVRARGLGIRFDGEPGMHNAITDVPGVEVGYRTLIRGDGALSVGAGPVRTGVTALLPRGRGEVMRPVFAGAFSLNGNGELTGTHWVEEAGLCEGPITLTNTHSCGLARDASIRWMLPYQDPDEPRWFLPVAGETFDGHLNDINGFHVTELDVHAALDGARGGPLELGSVGGGTGMICYGYKGGSGSASRRVTLGDAQYHVGVFVQANFGSRHELLVRGVPVGRHLAAADAAIAPGGSVIAVVATDAPLLPHQLKRLARRVSLGLARTGSVAHDGSGDIFLAFSVANDPTGDGSPLHRAVYLASPAMNPLFTAVVEATEEAVLDALIVNEDMTGIDGRTVPALPHDALLEIYERHAGAGEAAG